MNKVSGLVREWGMLWRIALLFSVSASCLLSSEPERPNFIFILGDDINRDQLGPYGGEALTPHLDELAREGMRFDRVYANVAMCAPFRQELYSGRSSWRTDTLPNHSRSKAETQSLPHYLRPLGYRVGLVGKSHVGPPEAYPFDMLGDVSKKEDGNPEMMQKATAYLDKALQEEAPFCLFFASHDGHGPYTTGDPDLYDAEALTIPPYWVDTPELREELVKHMAEITNLDALVGMVKDYLEENDLLERTILVFCSEQGNSFPFAKWTCFDHGLHTGVIASCPGTIPAGTVAPHLMQLADFAPTFIEAAGGTVESEDFDGRSQWANFLGGDQSVHSFVYGAFTNCRIIDNRTRVFPIRSIRDERYSLVWSPRGDEGITSNTSLSQALRVVTEGAIPKEPNAAASWAVQEGADHPLVKQLHHRPEWALYDRDKDPLELTNVADDPELKPVRERL
ncbi:MAG: sulfatase, partial [Verrucomicrobiota bacterium]